MRSYTNIALAGILLAGAALPSYALDLLGGGASDSLVTLGSGEAADSGLVNVGLGGGGVVDVNIGGSEPLAEANVGLGRDGDIVDANIGLLDGTATVTANVGGDSLLDIGVDIGVGIGGPGNPGNPGSPGNPGIAGNPGNAGNPGLPRVSGSNLANTGGGTACVGESANQVARLIRGTRVDASWMRASNVAIQRVQLCPDVKVWLSSQLAGSGLGQMLQNAVASDALISASLGRTSYGPDQVFAVKQSGSQLIVYVY